MTCWHGLCAARSARVYQFSMNEYALCAATAPPPANVTSGTRLLDAFDRYQTSLATTRAAFGGDGLMPNTTTTPP